MAPGSRARHRGSAAQPPAAVSCGARRHATAASASVPVTSARPSAPIQVSRFDRQHHGRGVVRREPGGSQQQPDMARPDARHGEQSGCEAVIGGEGPLGGGLPRSCSVRPSERGLASTHACDHEQIVELPLSGSTAVSALSERPPPPPPRGQVFRISASTRSRVMGSR